MKSELKQVTRVAILGAGYIVEFHIAAIQALPHTTIVAICDLNKRNAQTFADLYNIKNIYTDLSQMLANEELDVVHVLTPPHIHFDTTSQIIAAGVDVLCEKPLCHTVDYCQQIIKKAADNGNVIGVANNFLFMPIYEKFITDLRSGKLGKLDQIDIIWNKELGQLKGGPFETWMLQTPTNILFEVAPHSFVHLIHILAGQPDNIAVNIKDKVTLPGELNFYRKWEINGWKDNTSIRLRFSFNDSYPEHYISVHGSNASARVDFEHNTYNIQSHTALPYDVDHYSNVVVPAVKMFWQAHVTLFRFIISKLGITKTIGGSFAEGIYRAVFSFYDSRKTSNLNERISPELSTEAIILAERVVDNLQLPEVSEQLKPKSDSKLSQLTKSPTILVIGGTGFIGQSLVKRLCSNGYAVRVLARDPSKWPSELNHLNVELVKGTFTDIECISTALESIDYVYHLARGFGNSWNEYLKSDVEPTQRLAELSNEKGIKKFFYASSIAIYDAGIKSQVITEETLTSKKIAGVSPYARSKIENEKKLLKLHKEEGLPLVIFRPGIVLGKTGNPYHWGIVAWPFNSVCRIWGDGNNKLPIVMVEDITDAMVKAIDVPDIEGESYNLASPPTLTANDYIDEFEKRSGSSFKRVITSKVPYYLGELIKWSIKRIGKDPEAAFPSYAEINSRSFASTFDSTKAEKQLGWLPTKNYDELVSKGIHEPVDEFID